MARPLRIQYPGAVYHVMARGNHGLAIFQDDRDRQCFLETLGEACEKTGWRIHAYVLMGNHYHLLVETPEGNLVEGMKWVQGAYTQRYNSRHKLFGHLFQGRYKAVIVDGRDDDYFSMVSTYIHLNPARAKLIRIGAERLKRYRWSSYPWYINRAGKRPHWLITDRVLGGMNLGPKEVKGYEAYIEGRVLELGSRGGKKELEEEWEALRRGWYVGNETFLGKLQQYLDGVIKGRQRESHSGEAKVAHDVAAAEREYKRALPVLGLDEEWVRISQKGAPEKAVLAWWLRRRTTVSLRWVSERLNMGHYTRVTKAINRVGQRPDGKLNRIKLKLARLQTSDQA
jgi:REP element-mobilizing transposase RayT